MLFPGPFQGLESWFQARAAYTKQKDRAARRRLGRETPARKPGSKAAGSSFDFALMAELSFLYNWTMRCYFTTNTHSHFPLHYTML
uniref:Uncharacterized protein n=1 Tax=Paenibacillus athensensis TaxID=1967502 RepID=A0A4Y8QAF4_9BACL